MTEKCSVCGSQISGKAGDLPVYFKGECICETCFQRVVEAAEKERAIKNVGVGYGVIVV